MKTTVDNAKEQIINAIRTYLAKNKDGSYRMPAIGRLPIYLLGQPGIGKTEIVREVAEEEGLGYVSFSLTHHTRNSLLGLPVILMNYASSVIPIIVAVWFGAKVEKAVAKVMPTTAALASGFHQGAPRPAKAGTT